MFDWLTINLKEIKLQHKSLTTEVKVTLTSLKCNLAETQKSLEHVNKTLKPLKLLGPKITQIINFNL